MLKYDTKLTKELCQTLSEIINTSVSFYDENLIPQGHSKSINRTLCDAIRVNHLGVCLQTDKNTLKRFRDGETAFVGERLGQENRGKNRTRTARQNLGGGSYERRRKRV